MMRDGCSRLIAAQVEEPRVPKWMQTAAFTLLGLVVLTSVANSALWHAFCDLLRYARVHA